MVDFRILVIAARGCAHSQFLEALPPSLREGVHEIGGWHWRVSAAASVNLAGVEDALAELPATVLLLEGRESQHWSLRITAPERVPFEWVYPFWIVRLTASEADEWEQRSGLEAALAWLAEECAEAGATAASAMLATTRARSLAAILRLFSQRQAEHILAALESFAIPCNAAVARPALAGTDLLPGEVLAEIGNLPRLAASLGLGGLFDDWAELQRECTPTEAQESDRFEAVPEAEDAEGDDDEDLDWDDADESDPWYDTGAFQVDPDILEEEPFWEGASGAYYRVDPSRLPVDERTRLDVLVEDMSEAGFTRLGEYALDRGGAVFSGYAMPERYTYGLVILPVLASAIRVECCTRFSENRWLVTTMRPLEPVTPREEIQVQYCPKSSESQLVRRHRKRLRELIQEGWRPIAPELDLTHLARTLEDLTGAFEAR